ncbi:MAG: MFS transporter [Nocardioides sp.]
MAGLSESFVALRHRNFRWFYIATTVNLVGTTMSGVALAFAVLSISDSSTDLGYVLAAGTLPTVVFLLVGGVVADRLPLTLVLRAGATMLGITQSAVAALVITGTAQIWMLVCLSALNGTALALTFPALQSITPRLVPADLLQQANALQSLARGTFRVIGPSLAALLVVTVGPGWALAVDAVTWLGAAAILFLVRLPPRPPRAVASSAFGDLRAGWSYVRGTTWLWVVVVAFTALNAVQAGAWSTLGPPQAKATIGAQAWGIVLSAQSVGLLVTTFVMLRRPLLRPLRSGMLGIAWLGLPMLVLGREPHLALLVLATFAAGVGTEVFSLGWTLSMQEHVPPDMLSRAYSYDALGSLVAVPIGELAFGPLGAAFGYGPVLVASGLGYIVIALLTLTSRSVRDLRRVPAAVPQPNAG